MTETLTWWPTAEARRLVGLAGVAVAAAVAFGRPELGALAAVPLAFLLMRRQRRRPGTATVVVRHPERTFEGEELAVTVEVSCSTAVDMMRITLHPTARFVVATLPWSLTRVQTASALLDTSVMPSRWGRGPVGYVTVDLWAGGRLFHTWIAVWPAQEVSVYPRPAVLARMMISSARYDRPGDHVAEAAGAGVEFHSVRPFASGDRPAQVNWPVSTRKGSLYVTTTRAERAVDVILAVDVLTEAGPTASTSRDLALRGTLGVTQAVLKTHDRVGLIAVGGRLQWLRPDLSERQFYRIADAMLDVVDWHSFIEPNVETIPYSALPAGARVVYFSPLLDERGLAAARRLRQRGHAVTVVDVCTSEPAASSAHDKLMVRLWHLDRSAERARLAALGIVVVHWDGSGSLDHLLASVLSRNSGARR